MRLIGRWVYGFWGIPITSVDVAAAESILVRTQVFYGLTFWNTAIGVTVWREIGATW